MSTIVFIHGMWHNATCFDHIVNRLREQGYQATAITYRGNEPYREDRTVTFQEIMDGVVEDCSKIPGKLILVCHSSGGTVVLNSAPRFADKIEKIIFNNAFVLPHGKCQFDYIPDEIEKRMTDSALARPDAAIPVDLDNVRTRLMTRASEESIQQLLSILVPQPLCLMNTPSNSKPFFDLVQIPKRMVHCLDDKTFPPYGYADMFLQLPGTKEEDIVHIDCDHQGFFSNPDVFFPALLKCLQ